VGSTLLSRGTVVALSRRQGDLTMKRAIEAVFVASLCCVGAIGCAAPEAAATGSADVYSVALQVSTPSGLPKCGDALAGTTAYVASPAGLWSCTGEVWVPIPCVKGLAGAVAYAAASKTLWACVSTQWTPVVLPTGATGATGAQGPMGAQGVPGATGAEGDPGPQGATGAQGPAGPQGATGDPGQKGDPGVTGATGPQGAAGITSLVVQLPEAAGVNCAAGGTKIESGLDANGNQSLDAAEVTAISYVCDGAAGPTGAQGDPGAPGAPGTLLVVTPEPAGASCASGGQRVDTGADTNGNRALDATEVTSTAYVCNGSADPTLAATVKDLETKLDSLSCPSGYYQAGPKSCISAGGVSYSSIAYAMDACAFGGAHVCTFGELKQACNAVGSTEPATFDPLGGATSGLAGDPSVEDWGSYASYSMTWYGTCKTMRYSWVWTPSASGAYRCCL
jgi:hypothetical protein